MKTNDAYDDTLDESPENPKEIRAQIENSEGIMVDQRLTQAEFIESAGPLLTGESDVSKSLERGGYNKDATFNEDAKSTASVKKAAGKRVYEAEIDNYIQKETYETEVNLPGAGKNGSDIKGKLDFTDDEENVGAILKELYKDYNLNFTILDDDKIRIKIPGHPNDDAVLMADWYDHQDGKQDKQKQILNAYIKAYIKANEKDFAKKNSWKGKTKKKFN
jgi:hypothetical protein